MITNLANLRIRRPKKFRVVFEQLAGKGKGYNFIFSSYAQLMVFAASIGYYFKKKKAFKESDEPIQYNYLDSQDYYDSIFNSLAFLEVNKDVNIFDNKHIAKRAIIFEEYACGGLEILQDKVIDPPGENYLENIILLISQIDETSDPENVPKEFDLGF